MNELILHKSDKAFYRDKSINNAYISGTDKLPLIRFRCFSDVADIDAFFTTKKGGVSTGHLSSLNLGDDRGDLPENVLRNYGILADYLSTNTDYFVKTDQVHKTVVSYAGTEHLPAGPHVKKFPVTDGLFTDVPGLFLAIGAADCVPIYIASPHSNEIALVHSGWKGTVGKISAVAVNKLVSRGADPKSMIALIGPSISQENYEVTNDVIEKFSTAFSEQEMADIAYRTDDIHFQLDLWAACFYTLLDSGLKSDNIHFSSICTYENHNLLFSHRYTNGLRGNQNAIMYLR